MSQTLTGATNVTVSVWRNGIKLVDAATPSGGPTYTYTLPASITSYDGPIYIRWDYTIGGVTLMSAEEHEVVTPLMSFEGFTGPAYTEAQSWERLVRRIIESNTKQSFGMFYGPRRVSGRGLNFLELPQRMIELEGLEDADIVYNIDTFDLSDDGWFIKDKKPGTYTIKQDPLSNETIRPPSKAKTFLDGTDYTVSGVWGYASPPQPVLEACEILYNDYSCRDSNYRDRYLKEMRTADWSMKFSDLAFVGSGSVQADQLLSRYSRGGITVV